MSISVSERRSGKRPLVPRVTRGTLGAMFLKSDQQTVTVVQPTENKRTDQRLKHGAWHLSPNATQLEKKY